MLTFHSYTNTMHGHLITSQHCLIQSKFNLPTTQYNDGTFSPQHTTAI